MTNETKVKYGFGLDDVSCETEMFYSIEEVLKYAQASWDEQDGNPFDSDCDYSGCIYVGTIDCYEPSDFAPTLKDIADQMTDQFYSDHNIDNDDEVHIANRKEAEAEWKAFVNKYFDIPCTHIASWNVGLYDLKEHKWVERYDQPKEE